MLRRMMVLFAVFMVAAFPVVAQDDEALTFVTQAFENFAALETYTLEMEQSTTQDITAGEGAAKITLHQVITQQGEGEVNIETGDIAMQLDQEIIADSGVQTVALAMIMDIVVIDAVLYMRFEDVSEDFASMYPEGWINLSEGSATFPGADLLNPDTFIQLANTPMLYPINQETIVELVERDAETLNDETMRVFDLTMDMEAVFESGGGSIAGIFDADALGVDVERLIEEMMQSASMEMRVWIGEADELVHQIEAVVTISTLLPAELMGGTQASLTQETTARTTITEFNVPIEIETPEVE